MNQQLSVSLPSRIRTAPGDRRPHIVALSGNTRRPSRNLTLARAIGEAVASRTGCEIEYLDLIDAGPGLGAAFKADELDDAARSVVEAVSAADGLIVSSPVYKGSYPGLLKHLFDLVDPLALTERPVLLAAVGGGAKHALMIEHQLRPLFGFFTAFAIPTGVYASAEELDGGGVSDPALAQRIGVAAEQFGKVLQKVAVR